MNESEALIIALAAALSAGGGYAAAKAGAAKSAGAAPAPAPAQPAPAEDPKPHAREDPEKAAGEDASSGDSWRTGLVSQWGGVITTLSGLAAALGTYSLTKTLGTGDLSQRETYAVVAAAVAFAVGVGMLLMIPVSLRAKSKVLVADAVERQNRWNSKKHGGRKGKLVVPASSLFGYADITAFDRANEDLVKDLRETYWEQGQAPPPDKLARVRFFGQQRRQIEDIVATVELRRASRRAAIFAVAGMVLAVVGFTTATVINNSSVRDAKLTDARTERANTVADARTQQFYKMVDAAQTHTRSLQTKVLDDALAQPSVGSVLPALPSAVVVTFPDGKTAADALGVPAADLDAACWSERTGSALAVGEPPAGTDPNRVVFVAFPATKQCPAGAAWVEVGWRVAA
ncbi:hypothetical protein [Nocardioides aquiterrae]|uniref:Uncharacterized protein n=1 Tax=Nocardioides aquiterrae TaxID=203799 RepID=A0ABN1UEB9_9ACTN